MMDREVHHSALHSSRDDCRKLTQHSPNQSVSSEISAESISATTPASLQQETKSPKQRTEREIHEFK
jgi:hypothetical protein